MPPRLAQLPPHGLRTRFAPSPTGYLHLGHVAAALYVWGLAQVTGAQVHLRIEDHDRQRCRSEWTQALLEDLAWLGFIDASALPEDFSIQSRHPERYQSALQKLVERGLVYACDCSRKQLLERLGVASAGSDLRYDGYCRERGYRLDAGLGLRLLFDRHVQSFDDLLQGRQVQIPSDQCGDLLLRDRHGNWTYNFAVLVDDHEEGVDWVIRGLDLIDATGRQMQLAQLLQVPGPRYWLHHPLIVGEDGRKLSKRFGSTALRTLRDEGLTSSMILGMVAHRVGLIEYPRPLQIQALGELFA